jgi:purine nucleosidase
LSLISWETTVAYGFTPEQIDFLMNVDSPRGAFFRRITQRTVEFFQRAFGRTTLFAPDPLAVAVALEPGIVRKSELRYVQVELSGSLTRGQTTVDWFNLTQKAPNVDIVLEVDADRFWELMQAAVQ